MRFKKRIFGAKKKYDVFISYRRDGGEYTARIIRDKLSQLGYRAFFDVESLRSGNFNTELYSVIEECNDFILILSPGALDRCKDEDDWVRQEIVHALKKEKNIVPVMLRNFEFPKQMPEAIEPLRYKNGLPADSNFFDAFIEKLSGFLQSKPLKVIRWKRALPAVSVAAMIFLVVAGMAIWNYTGLFPYPRTAAEKNLTGDLLYYIEINLQQIEQAADCMNKVYETCERQLAYEDMTQESLSLTMKQYRSTFYQMNTEQSTMPKELVNGLKDSPFSSADAIALHDYNLMLIQSCLDDIYYLEYVISDEAYMDKSTKKQILDNYRKLMDEELKCVSYGALQMLIPVKNENSLDEFKQKFLPMLTYIPLRASDWSYDAKALESDESKSYENINKIENDISVLIGESNIALMEEKSQLIQMLVEDGYTVEQAEQLVGEIVAQADSETKMYLGLQELQKKVEEAETALAKSKEEAKEKFAPADGDDGDVLWGKMLRFLSIGMYDDAIACVDAYRETMRAEDENVEIYTAAAVRFIRNISNTGIDYGAMIVDYEFGETEDDPRKIGDVIIALNGKPCYNWEEYTELRESVSDSDDYTIVVLRDSGDGNGTLEQVQLTVTTDSQRLYLYDMTEKTYK